MIPKISNYGNYSSDNYGAHTLKMDLGTIELYYSYETIVAYSDDADGLVQVQYYKDHLYYYFSLENGVYVNKMNSIEPLGE